MSTIYVRGREIDVQAKPNQKIHYMRLYEGYDDARLDMLERETKEYRQEQRRRLSKPAHSL